MNYDNETPMNDKFLMADGSIRNANGQTVQSPNEYWKQRYKQATPIPAKFLHADGTIDENIGGGGGRTRQKLKVTTNGYYNTPDGVYYDPISVNVPLSALGVTMEDVQAGKLTTAGTPVTLSYEYGKGSDANYVVWIGSEQINTRDLAVGQTYNYTTSGSGLTFDITLKKETASGGARYKVTAEIKDRGKVYAPLNCFLVVGELN